MNEELKSLILATIKSSSLDVDSVLFLTSLYKVVEEKINSRIESVLEIIFKCSDERLSATIENIDFAVNPDCKTMTISCVVRTRWNGYSNNVANDHTLVMPIKYLILSDEEIRKIVDEGDLLKIYPAINKE